MRDVYDFAKFFIKKGADTTPNTFDGNMKLQKLLTFANMVNIAEYNEPLFPDNILAFKNGCVVEKVRIRYKDDYDGLKHDSDLFEPDFSDEEYNVLNIVLDIFGAATAKELSDINHEFESWKEAYNNGIETSGFHNKDKSIVDFNKHKDDISKLKEIIQSYYTSKDDVMAKEIINGITFYYDNIKLTDDMIDRLFDFSITAEEEAYNVYFDNGQMVIY